MAKFVVFFFLFLTIAFVESCCPCYDDPCNCGENEVWKDCGGCDGCCVNPKPCCGDAKGPPGCYCKPGYVRDHHGNCIKVCDCPTCDCSNEEFRCGNCDFTCKNRKGCCCACRWGCFCRYGYIRDENGRCIRGASYPSGSSEEYESGEASGSEEEEVGSVEEYEYDE